MISDSHLQESVFRDSLAEIYIPWYIVCGCEVAEIQLGVSNCRCLMCEKDEP
jgi:hypothetical protein